MSGDGAVGATARSLNPSQRRRERERMLMRARLLSAAREIAADEGWQAVTIRKIADRLEYASPVLYQYFPGKEALLLALMAEGFATVTGQLREAVERCADDPERLLVSIAIAYWDFAFAAPELYQAMNGLDGVPFGTAEAPAEARQGFLVVRGALESLGERRGRVLKDPEGAVDTLWAYLHGFVSLTMAGRIAGGKDNGRALMLRALPGLFDTLE
jgi:AcrR family transcriptional regulator